MCPPKPKNKTTKLPNSYLYAVLVGFCYSFE
jgi:hypothetical protein